MAILAEDVKRVVISAVEGQHAGLPSSAAQWPGPGLVAQGRTVAETLNIARDVAKRLLEARAERGEHTAMNPVGDCLDLPLVVGA